MSGSAFRLPEL